MGTVFVSHRGADSDVASRVARDLRAQGIDVWLDVDEVRVGDSILVRMNDGLERATHVVVVYSDETTPGNWMDREWLSALARQLEGDGVRLLPVRIGTSIGPSLLRDVKYADLTADWDAGIVALVNAIVSRQ